MHPSLTRPGRGSKQRKKHEPKERLGVPADDLQKLWYTNRIRADRGTTPEQGGGKRRVGSKPGYAAPVTAQINSLQAIDQNDIRNNRPTIRTSNPCAWQIGSAALTAYRYIHTIYFTHVSSLIKTFNANADLPKSSMHSGQRGTSVATAEATSKIARSSGGGIQKPTENQGSPQMGNMSSSTNSPTRSGEQEKKTTNTHER